MEYSKSSSIVLLSFHIWILITVSALNFTIDYEHDTFLKDGQAFRYISGTIHYARTPHYYWHDRLMKMHAAGFNAVQTYVFWNIHEPMPGVYNFSGQQDLLGFLKVAQQCGLHVILRGIPYSCAEWDYGGLPAWLLSDTPHVVVRTMDPAFIKPLDRWLDVLLPKIRPMLYGNGGPIITVQVENEYGSYFACDHTYMRYLRHKLVMHLGKDVVLFTTDGDGEGYLKCGTLEGVYATVDFGLTLDPEKAFRPQRMWEPHGPLVNSEFYVGWLDHWHQNHSHFAAASCARSLDALLAYGANINVYVFAGGTSFAYYNGANYPPYQPVTTSYDYDGVVSEAGDITPKYLALRKVIAKYRPLPPIPIPPSTPKFAYGNVQMIYVGHVYDLMYLLAADPITSPYPLSMEKLHHYYGFMLYRHITTVPHQSARLCVPGLRDRAYIALNHEPYGLLERGKKMCLQLDRVIVQQEINILVENQGHINHGSGMLNNSKGIIGNVTLAGRNLINWDMFPLHLDSLDPDQLLRHISRYPRKQAVIVQKGKMLYTLPSVFMGKFTVTQPAKDTYLDPRPFTKGQAFINSYNVGRYWPQAGPQVTLFVPKGFLRGNSQNTVTFVELEYGPSQGHSMYCTFTDHPWINKTVPAY